MIFNNALLFKITSIHLLSKDLLSAYSIPGPVLSVAAMKIGHEANQNVSLKSLSAGKRQADFFLLSLITRKNAKIL